MKKAVIVFSGGLDSTTCLALAKAQGFDCYCLAFEYDHRHACELNAAKKIADHFQVPLRIMHLPIGELKHSALTDMNIPVADYTGSRDIPATYVPARNTIFLTMALAYAEVNEAQDIFIGISSVDYSGYPDCRPEYFAAFEKMANLATKAAIEGNPVSLHAPLIYLSKADTIKLGLQHGVDYSMTVSCYRADSEGRACGRCDSCMLRKKGFAEAQISDPTLYYSI